MPTADKLTAIREACDLDVIEETVWAYLSLPYVIASPELEAAVRERARILNNPDSPDWYSLKARQCV
jgi:hypothetical protein